MEQLSGNTLNIVNENIDALKQLFPDAFSEDKIDFDKLQGLLGKNITNNKEKYSFSWKGKSDSIKLSLAQNTGTLRPDRESSKNWDTTGNLYIEGDNLEVLRTLQDSYRGQIKMIYIDPPYNTGKDFVYEDNFVDNVSNYKEIMGEVMKSNPETNGRYHTDWLNMMYPRLKLARNLMTDDGIIFISIGEQEVHNLRKICDEIFGEQNFIGEAGRISKKANNQGDFWAPNFDFVLTYSKNKDFCSPFFGGINYKAYKEIETKGDRKGDKYQLIRLYMTSLDPMRGCKNQRYYIECPDGSFVIPPGENFPDKIEDGAKVEPKSGKDKVWRWGVKSYLEKKDLLFVKKVSSSNLVDQDGKPAKWNVFTKTFLNDVIEKSSASPNNFIENHLNQSSSHELKKLDIPFDFAKPSSLIKFLGETCRFKSGDIILDFFSGSATTAHATISMNAEDGGNRKFICIQLPEKIEENTDIFKAGYKNICEIGKERIRRAGKYVIDENKDKDGIENLDTGFKVFKLDTTNLKKWETTVKSNNDKDIKDELQTRLTDMTNPVKEDREQVDMIYEIMLKNGMDLSLPMKELEIQGKKVFNIASGYLIICLEKNLSLEIIKEICDLKPKVAVFYDESFKDDVVKLNAIEQLEKQEIQVRVI